MTRNDVLNDERIKRYSEGKATPTDLAELRALAETEPLYAEALALFAPLTEGEQGRILEAARLQVQLAELKEAAWAVLRDANFCALCKGLTPERLSFDAAVQKLKALLEDDE